MLRQENLELELKVADLRTAHFELEATRKELEEARKTIEDLTAGAMGLAGK